jgi:glucosamine-6-phosphate deaminase
MTEDNSVVPVATYEYDNLPVAVYASNLEMGTSAALRAAEILSNAINSRGEANLILATGNSQLTFLYALGRLPDINWTRVRIFHMDEYIGVDEEHPASFHRYLCEHIVDHVRPGAFYPISGDLDRVEATCREYEELLRRYPADLVALGFGENGHLAFNDPPYATFDDPDWVKVVELAEKSRRQQVGEGHFPALELVPTQAITLTIPALLAADKILAIVPEERKAEAVRACLTEPVSEERPGSVLRTVSHAQLFLDTDSAALLAEG